MKLLGVPVYLIPIIITVSLCTYVYFLSKDILTLDREVRILKSTFARLQTPVKPFIVPDTQTSVASDSAPAPEPVPAPAPEPAPLQETPAPIDIAFSPNEEVHIEQVSAESNLSVETPISLDIDIEEDAGSVDSEKVKTMMKGIEEFEFVSPKTDYTMVELRNKCKEKGVSGKGSKMELKQRLGL